MVTGIFEYGQCRDCGFGTHSRQQALRNHCDTV
jgi:hypothetical protein